MQPWCHKMSKKLCFIGIWLFLLVGCIEDPTPKPTPTEEQKDKLVNVEILEMNDIHGHIEDEGNGGGLARASSLIEGIRKETKEDNTLLIGNGDMLQETAISRVSYGQVVIDAMNQMKFDMMGIGNHEFDWGFDRFLNFFDGKKENGEADFPLINSNIYYQQKLVEANKVCSSQLIEKEDVTIGVLSYIGDVFSSINANMTTGYSFKATSQEIADSVAVLGTSLKEKGADLIVVNIHGGESSSCLDYETNLLLSKLFYKDTYLVDAVINGHTHTKQNALIERENGVDLPVVQSSGRLSNFGRIDLTYNTTKKKVTQAKVAHISVSSAKESDEQVDQIISEYYQASKDILEEVYCTNHTYLNRYSEEFQAYISNVMMAATGATASICNTGAFRNNVGIGNFDFNALYALNPFDNHIIICEINGIDLKRFLDANRDKEIVYTKEYGASIATDQTYTLAILDYVYFGPYFAGYRTDVYTDTQLVLRDLIASDLRLRKKDGFVVARDYNQILMSWMVS